MAVSPSELGSTFFRLKALAAHHGIDSSRWVLITGSVTYGRAFGIFNRDPVTGGLSDVMRLDKSRTASDEILRGGIAALSLIP